MLGLEEGKEGEEREDRWDKDGVEEDAAAAE